jgi:hypothetical protein
VPQGLIDNDSDNQQRKKGKTEMTSAIETYYRKGYADVMTRKRGYLASVDLKHLHAYVSGRQDARKGLPNRYETSSSSSSARTEKE